MAPDARGRTMCELLEWDTKFFGIRVARVVPSVVTSEDIAAVLAWCEEEAVDCLYFLCDPSHDDSVRLAERAGFHLVDVRLVFAKNLGKADGGTSDRGRVSLRRWHEGDFGALESIAGESYRDTRFWFDRNFPRERVVALYQEWVARSCRGFADEVLVAETDQGVAGFVTCHVDAGDKGRIGLLGVRSEAQGRGVGTQLVAAAATYCVGRGAGRLEVATQGRNLAAQRLYQRSGFVTASMHLWYHRWFEGGRG
jgi:dTDP-4-amino-4,6-dideoxy-D-galactose acyltransferase